ncbi:6-phosphofructo-2-kinase/fructose-2,6-biphosphatase, putative [Leishmania panamensis]|uniref:6-phosphofructo-2-kinase/fructose-2,6-biphosphatase, putative n=1 Tax=Leishmania panamensis TaxID=5679 RepID=A0A088RHR2_LEIPA|nr:6-phosphofructo-2-kinase/fructose-2,6-biphosphatase, putative [Leishmania panamensis]AIN95310.1 6-phosphofructo-2-kinase/fructose-2,6-biphosphatase, putative [Leishmania panamensis]
MSEARASVDVAHPRAADDKGGSQGYSDRGHHHLSPPQHEQSWTEALIVNPPSPGDVGLEPPVWHRPSTDTTSAYPLTTRTLTDPQGQRSSGRGGNHTRATPGAADGGNGSSEIHSLASASPHLAMRGRRGSTSAVGTPTLSQHHQQHHRLGKHSPGMSTVDSHGHAPAEVTQYTPAYIKASRSPITPPAAAWAGANRSRLRVRRKQRSNPVGLTASAHAWHWGTAPVAAVAFQQRQQQGRCRQRRAVAESREGAPCRRHGRNTPVPLFSNVPTTAAMGAAVAARAQKAAPNRGRSSLAAREPVQRAAPTSSAPDRTAVFTFPHATPVPSGGGSLPAVLESSPTQIEAASISPTRKVPGEDTPPQPGATTTVAPLSACASKAPASVSAGAAAPANSHAAPQYFTFPPSHTQRTGCHLGGPHGLAPLRHFEPATCSTVADGAKPEDDISPVDAAARGAPSPLHPATGVADQEHLEATDQSTHGDDSRVESVASGVESSMYSLVHSHQTSDSARAYPASTTQEDLVETAAAMDRAFTSMEAHMAHNWQRADDARVLEAPQPIAAEPETALSSAFSKSRATGNDAVSDISLSNEAADARALSRVRSAVTVGMLTNSPHYRCTDNACSAPGNPGGRSRFSEGGATSDAVASGSPEAQQRLRPRIAIATSLEEEALLQQYIAAGGGPGIRSVDRATILAHPLTAPPYVADPSSVAVSGRGGGSSVSTSPFLLTQQQRHTNTSNLLSASAVLGQRTTSGASNSFWSSSSVPANAFNESSPVIHSSIYAPGSPFTTAAGAPTMRDAFAASVSVQQNKSALITELKRRRQRLQRKLALLQEEATARNIFALVRASNASQLQYLLQEGLCNVNDRDYNACTPLHVAAGEGNQAIVRLLLSFGADVVAVDHNGRTPLDCAAANRHSGVARYLLTVIRTKHFSQDGGDGGFTSSGGDDGPPVTMCGPKSTMDEGSLVTGVYPSLSTSPVGQPSERPPVVDIATGALPLGNSPAGSISLGTTTFTQRNTAAQCHSELSPTGSQGPPLPLSHQRQQYQQPASSLSAASTPSLSRPENLNQLPAHAAASGTITDAESWTGSDALPHTVGWGTNAPPATAAAAGTTASSGAPPTTIPKSASSLAVDDISGAVWCPFPPLSTTPQHLAPPQGAAATAKSVGANSSLTGHLSIMSVSTPRWRHSSIPHGSSPMRPVFLSSLDSTAAAHSRGLIAAESNTGTTPTAPPPRMIGVNAFATKAGSASAGGGGQLLKRHVMSTPMFVAGGIEESVSEETSQAAAQQPPSRLHFSTSLITPAATAGTMAGWHDGDEPLVDTDVEGIEDALLDRRGHCSMHRRCMQSESSSSPHGEFGSVLSDWSRSGSLRTLATGKEKQQHNRKDCSSFNETGSFPGEVPPTLSPPPAPTAATGAAAVRISSTSTAASGGGAPQRQMLLRPPRLPDSRPPPTERGGTKTAPATRTYPMHMLRPLNLLPVDMQEELGGDHGSVITSATTAPTAASAVATTSSVYSQVCGPLKSQEDLTSSTLASGAGSLRGVGAGSGSLCDMGQQSLEEHHHHYRMAALGMLVSQQQLRDNSGVDKRPAPPLLQTTRAALEPIRMEATVTDSASPSGDGSSSRSAVMKNSSSDVTPFPSYPQVAADPAVVVPSLLSSTGPTTATSAEATGAMLAGAVELVREPMASPHAAKEQSLLQEVQHEPADLATLHYSSYTTISDTVSVIVCMVGLPGRGKSFISKRLVRYMNWKGVPCRAFNAGNYRRQLLGAEGTADAEFFNPDNPQGAQLRERMAEFACEDLVRFIAAHSLAVGILDATNTTRRRRAWLAEYFQHEAQRHAVPYRLLFIESVCTDDTIVTENILRSKCDNDDFRNLKDVGTVINEFRNRILQYERVYETLEPEERMPYIKIVNVKHHVILHRVPNGLGSRIAFFLLNLHPIAFPIYVALPGETVGDSMHVYGGEDRLTSRGEAYAVALKHFIQDRYVPHMVVLHATNYSVLSTLTPLMDSAKEEETAPVLHAPSSASGHGASACHLTDTSKAAAPAPQHPHDGSGDTRRILCEASVERQPATGAAAKAAPMPADASTIVPDAAVLKSPHSLSVVPGTGEVVAEGESPAEAPRDPQQRDGDGGGVAAVDGRLLGAVDAVALEQFMHEDDSDQVDEEEIGDEVLCPVPGLDNINFGRFSGHTAAWVKEKYPRLSALLYDVDDGNVSAGAAAQQHQQESRKYNDAADATMPLASAGSANATGSASHHRLGQGNETHLAAAWLSAPLPPQVHYATHEEAVSHLQGAVSGADPRLSYCTQLPNGESYRQVNVRLEPALMAVMRTQSPVFVVAPAVPAQGILSFFMDVIPELSPTIRIPSGCVVEIGVKDGITVHPLLPDALPESMTRSLLTVLPEIQEAIREVATASSVEKRTTGAPARGSATTESGGAQK